MEYCIYRLEFPYGVHFGDGNLSGSKHTFGADTFFSALCIEAKRRGEEALRQFVQMAVDGEILFSDSFPFMGESYYLPKPYIRLQREGFQKDHLLSKQFKNVDYIHLEYFSDYLEGEYPPKCLLELDGLGNSYVREVVSIRGVAEPLPFRIGIYCFSKGNGLYLIVGYTHTSIRDFFEELLEALSFTGMGGKRAEGLGRFVCYRKELPKKLKDRLSGKYNCSMLLSAGLPVEDELEMVLEDATYMLSRRGGFIQSEYFDTQQKRKKDVYLLDTGSCVKTKFQGQIIDVRSGGTHPVFRYANPIFLGVF
ncbi:MAG: type III-A CRISPR-associated RAMP protein Csm4 [Lachnospiraceae bacterium]|nr:type III-A CRISPR-associated RAMP protein Csm4 [Lachnospiraceae bacterium]